MMLPARWGEGDVWFAGASAEYVAARRSRDAVRSQAEPGNEELMGREMGAQRGTEAEEGEH